MVDVDYTYKNPRGYYFPDPPSDLPYLSNHDTSPMAYVIQPSPVSQTPYLSPDPIQNFSDQLKTSEDSRLHQMRSVDNPWILQPSEMEYGLPSHPQGDSTAMMGNFLHAGIPYQNGSAFQNDL